MAVAPGFHICWSWWKRAKDRSNQALCSLLVTAVMMALLDGTGLPKMEMVSTGAVPPFRLVNPLDEMDWRNISNALLFQDADDDAKRQAMLQMAHPPLYADWLPYAELAHCATCCVGEILVMQSMIGTEIDPGRDNAVLDVVL